MNAPATPSLEIRIRQVRADIDAIIDAKARAMARQSPGVPLGVIRNLLTARAGACSCAQYFEIVRDEISRDTVPQEQRDESFRSIS